MTNEELNEKFAALAIAQAKTEAQMAITEAQMARTDAQIARNEAKLTNMGIHIGGIANSHGQSTEEYFYNSLFDNPRLGNITFNEISKNLHNKIPNLEDEFDITMFNGNNVALIECKYRAKEEDVVKLIEKKVGNFRLLYPSYASHTIYLGIAGFSFDARLEKFAKENGVAILKQKGDVVEIEADNLKAY